MRNFTHLAVYVSYNRQSTLYLSGTYPNNMKEPGLSLGSCCGVQVLSLHPTAVYAGTRLHPAYCVYEFRLSCNASNSWSTGLLSIQNTDLFSTLSLNIPAPDPLVRC